MKCFRQKMIATAIEKYTMKDIGAPKVITSETQHDQYVSVLLSLDRKDHLTPEEKSFSGLLALLIENYEDHHHAIKAASPIDVLKELMAANDLRQRTWPSKLGSESIVSEVLSGKRELNKHHIDSLSKRFGVSPEVFF